MKASIALLFLVLAVTAFASSPAQTPINPDNSIIMEQERPTPSFFDSMWAKLTKYYRYAKRKVHCYVWGKECQPRVSHPPTLTTSNNDPFNAESNWFEKINTPPPSLQPRPVVKIQHVANPVENQPPQELIDLDSIITPNRDSNKTGKRN